MLCRTSGSRCALLGSSPVSFLSPAGARDFMYLCGIESTSAGPGKHFPELSEDLALPPSAGGRSCAQDIVVWKLSTDNLDSAATSPSTQLRASMAAATSAASSTRNDRIATPTLAFKSLLSFEEFRPLNG
jgi:hypothetical protein